MLRDDEDLGVRSKPKTVFAVKIDHKNYRFWKEMWQVSILLGALALIGALISGGQYYYCTSINPEATFFECMSQNSFDRSKK